jgi:CMP/dCMP kinase
MSQASDRGDLKRLVIAVDGPSASGKGTVSRAVATELGIVWIDTGALYRVVALLGQREGVELDSGESLARLVEAADIDLQWDGSGTSIKVDGEEFAGLIRTEIVGQGASAVAKQPAVRKALLQLQRDMAANGGVVMDGRDIGSVVLPAADLKVYLTASLEVRAQRRFEEQIRRGVTTTYGEVELEISARDHQDMTRQHAPLVQARDAYEVDTSHLTVEEAVAFIVGLAGDVAKSH